MSRNLKVIGYLSFVCLIGVFLVACPMPGVLHHETPGTTDFTGGITGKVVAQGQADNSGVTVTAEPTDGIKSNSVQKMLAVRQAVKAAIAAQATTDSSGTYSLTGLPPGVYTVSAVSKDGLEKAMTASVTVSAGSTAQALLMILTQTGQIQGTVTLGDGQDPTGVVVFIAGSSYSAMTDHNGSYLMSYVPAGRNYTLVASKDGYVSAIRNVDVTVNKTTTLASIALASYVPPQTTGSVSGNATLKDAPASAGIFVYLAGTSHICVTDADGNFSLTGVAPDTYTIMASKEGFSPQSGTVTVTKGIDAHISFTLTPLGPCFVTYNANGATGGNVPIDPTNYLPGYKVTVLGNSGSLVNAGNGLAGWNTKTDGMGTTYTPGQTFLMGVSDMTLYAVWIPAETTHTLSGMLVSPNGGGVPDGTYAYLKVVNSSGLPTDAAIYWTRSSAFSGGSASYSIADMATGAYAVYAFIDMNANAPNTAAAMPDAGDYVLQNGKLITISGDQTLNLDSSGWALVVPPGQHHYLTGKIIDSGGLPAPGATVEFANSSAITAADGSFSIDLGTGTGTMTGDFYVHGPTITLLVVTGVSLNAGVDTNVTLALEGMGDTHYHNVGGRIYERQTNPAVPTEIETGSQVNLFFRSRSGGSSSSSYTLTYDRTYGYGTETPVIGTDCLVTATVRLPGKNPFNVVVPSVDLTSSSTTLDLTQDLEHTTTVTVNGDAVGNIGTAYLVSPYGCAPAGFYQFTSSSSAQINLTNPYDYAGVWTQMKFVSDYPMPGYSKVFLSASSEAPIGTSVSLPAIDSLFGPTGAADPATLSYSSSSGVLSVSPAAGAQFYSFSLRDNSTGEALGGITTSNASVALPQWLRSQLGGRSIKVGVQPMGIKMNGSPVAMDVSTLCKIHSNVSTVTPGIAMAIVMPTGSNTKDLMF